MMKAGDYSAFPIQASDAQGSLYADQGLTKREYMAAMAMNAIATSTANGWAVSRKGDAEHIAKTAVQLADALMAALHTAPDASAAP